METCITDSDCNGEGTCSRNQEDADDDSIGTVCDNCPDVKNPYQKDTDNDGVGDVCDTGTCEKDCQTELDMCLLDCEQLPLVSREICNDNCVFDYEYNCIPVCEAG
jgi:hypothetical protein